jgi:hypothetical protein
VPQAPYSPPFAIPPNQQNSKSHSGANLGKS